MEQNRLHPTPAPRSRTRAFLLGAVTMSLLGGGLLWAADGTLFVFKPGEPIRASELNHNFDLHKAQLAALESAVTVLEAKVADYEDGSCPPGYTNITASDASFASVRAKNPQARLCKRGADEMVRVGDTWIDRFESVVVNSAWYLDGLCNGTGVRYGAPTPTCQASGCDDYPSTFPDNGQGEGLFYSCSISGHRPSTTITWFQAQRACSASGKRLPTNAEWQAAAAGVENSSTDGSLGSCVTTGSTRRATGGGTDCRSAYGAEDMSGNLYEPTAEWYQAGLHWFWVDAIARPWPNELPEYGTDGTRNVNGRAYVNDTVGFKEGIPAIAVRGGSFGSATDAGPFSFDLTIAPSHSSSGGGFRCARSR